MSEPILLTHSGAVPAAPAFLGPAVGMPAGTITGVRVLFPEGNVTDDACTLDLYINGAAQSVGLVVPEGDDEFTVSGLSIAVTDDSSAQFRILSPLPTLPAVPYHFWIYYTSATEIPYTHASASSAAYLDFKEDTDNGTNRVRLTGPASTADVAVTLPAATDTLVGKATTDVLTNKSIDFATNTVTTTLAQLNTAISDGNIPVVDDTAYDATSWNANTDAPTKNAVRDKFEALSTELISDTAYDPTSWNAVTAVAPSKNAVRDKIDSMISDTAYDATSWNAVTDVAPSKNAVRDEIEDIYAAIAGGVADGDKGDITVSSSGTVWTADADAVVKMTGTQSIGGAKTFTSDVVVPDEAYDATNWNGSLEVPTKNAVRDVVETIVAAGVSDGDKGDITVSSSGTVWTIDSDVVTYAKMQNISAASKVLGRGDSGSGDAQEITLGTNLSMSGTTLNASGGGISWTEVTGTSQSAAVDNGYITNNASLVTVTLPDTAAVGKIVAVQGLGAGGWKIAQNASEQIIWTAGGVDGSNETTIGTGGSLASTDQYDSVCLMCVVADTTWVVHYAKGAITLV